MPTACILHPQARVRLNRERLEVWAANEAKAGELEILREIPLRDLDRLIFAESVQISSGALAALLRGNIPVNLLGWNGQFLGGFLPPAPAHGRARLRQYQRTLDPAFALPIAARIVTAKLYNQRRVLQRLLANRDEEDPDSQSAILNPKSEIASPLSGIPNPKSKIENQKSEIQSALSWLDNLFASISRAQTIDEVRGYEGVCAARYFECWAAFLPAEFPFERRSTRPPHNAVNACISFGATLVYQEMVSFLHAHGLDPALGLLHNTEDGRWSLALDLIEPFRPAFVEALALDLFSRQILNAKNFESKNGGIYLNEDGRKKFLLQYERRMERQFMSECAGHRTTLRQQLENQAVLFKAALEDPAKFEPFVMN